MAAITSLGIGTNGLDLESLVNKLVAGERTPITQLQSRTATLKTQLSSYGKVQSALATVRDAAAKLTKPDTWGASTATSSDTSSVSVTATTGAALGGLAISVSQLATAQTVVTGVQPASPAAVGQGSITVELGKWNADQSAFTSKAGVTAITIDIASGEDQLTQIRDKVNAANAGVVASVVTDSSGSRLVMRSSSTGEDNGFRVSVNDADGNSGDATGLSALAFDPTAGVTSMTQKLAASNAHAMVNGVDVNSATNTLTTAVDGLSIGLLKVTSGDVSVTVGQDKDSIKKAVTDFATAYSALMSLMRDQTKAVPLAKGSKDVSQSGPLQGDATAVGLQSQLRNIAGGSSTLGGTLSRLSDLGLEPGTDGTLTVNATKLDAAIARPDDLKKLFMGLDSSNADNNGIAQKLRSFADAALGTEGTLSSRQTGLQTRITNNGTRSTELEAHVGLVEARLRARYNALDTQMASLNALSSYVTQQFASKSSN
ncbi:flagellar filament capping protein FliD [soil metagenome]